MSRPFRKFVSSFRFELGTNTNITAVKKIASLGVFMTNIYVSELDYWPSGDNVVVTGSV